MTEDNLQHAERLCRLFCSAIRESVTYEAIRRAGDERITTTQFQSLEYIHAHPDCCIKNLADGVQVSHPAAVKLVERMVAHGLAVRSVSSVDRRMVQLRATRTGAELITRVQRERQTLTEVAFEAMGSRRARGLLSGIRAFIRAAIRVNGDLRPAVCLRCGLNHSADCPLRTGDAPPYALD